MGEHEGCKFNAELCKLSKEQNKSEHKLLFEKIDKQTDEIVDLKVCIAQLSKIVDMLQRDIQDKEFASRVTPPKAEETPKTFWETQAGIKAIPWIIGGSVAIIITIVLALVGTNMVEALRVSGGLIKK